MSDPDVDIRPWLESDFALLERLLGDPSMTVYLGGPESPEKLRERHQRYLDVGGSADSVFAIVVGTERKAAGWVGYWESEWQGNRVWETGWHVLPEFQGRGIATAATTLALERARAEHKHRFVHALPAVDNAASNAVCRKLGFELRGEEDIEYPPGRRMRANDWRFDLEDEAARSDSDRPGEAESLGAQESAETLGERIARVTSERVEIVDYDPSWPAAFECEKAHLLDCLPQGIVVRVEHFGSTAVPGLAAKPIVDMLVEVTDLAAVRERVVPLLEAQGYEYFWRPTTGDDGPPFYAWFIKRDPVTGTRTHHIHMVGSDFSEHWERLDFRDYLRQHPDVAEEYGALKRRLADRSPGDRVRYTRGKTDFIQKVTRSARADGSSP